MKKVFYTFHFISLSTDHGRFTNSNNIRTSVSFDSLDSLKGFVVYDHQEDEYNQVVAAHHPAIECNYFADVIDILCRRLHGK